jgi:hypothetical protein
MFWELKKKYGEKLAKKRGQNTRSFECENNSVEIRKQFYWFNNVKLMD